MFSWAAGRGARAPIPRSGRLEVLVPTDYTGVGLLATTVNGDPYLSGITAFEVMPRRSAH